MSDSNNGFRIEMKKNNNIDTVNFKWEKEKQITTIFKNKCQKCNIAMSIYIKHDDRLDLF